MVDINLLPRDQAPNKSDTKLVALANKVAIFACGVFLIVVLVGAGAYFFFARNLEAAKESGAELTANVQSLQATESSLILLKDRLQKIQTTLAARTSENYLARQSEIIALAPSDTTFGKSEIDTGNSLLEIRMPNSRSMVSFFSTLIASSDFSSLFIEELAFNPLVGYAISIQAF